MRPKKRLYKLWKFFKIKKNIIAFFELILLQSKEDSIKFSKIFLENYKDLKEFHFSNIDLRFIQVIQIQIAWFPGFAFYKEDEQILMLLGLSLEEAVLWGVNYTKSMKKLRRTKWTYLKDLSTPHIKAIVEGGYTKDPILLKYFNKKLNDERTI